jgi:hypothetical protein
MALKREDIVSLTTEQQQFIQQLHGAAEGFQLVEGHWQLIEQAGLYSSPHLKSLAEQLIESAIGGDYDIKNSINSIYSEILIRGFFKFSPEEYISHFIETKGGDNGIDGAIHGVNYDVKVTEKDKPSRVKKTNAQPWTKYIYIFTALNTLKPGHIVFKVRGYAWHNEALPYFFKDAGHNPRGHRVNPSVLADNGILEADLASLRDRLDLRFSKKIKWDAESSKGIWITSE